MLKETLREEIQRDTTINKESINTDMLNQPIILSKYTKLLLSRTGDMRDAKRDMARIYFTAFKQYKEKYNVVLTKAETDIYASADDKVQAQQKIIDTYQGEIDELSKAIDNMKQMYWSARLYLDYCEYLKGNKS